MNESSENIIRELAATLKKKCYYCNGGHFITDPREWQHILYWVRPEDGKKFEQHRSRCELTREDRDIIMRAEAFLMNL